MNDCTMRRCLTRVGVSYAHIIVIPQYPQYGVYQGQGGGYVGIYRGLCPQGVGFLIAPRVASRVLAWKNVK